MWSDRVDTQSVGTSPTNGGNVPYEPQELPLRTVGTSPTNGGISHTNGGNSLYVRRELLLRTVGSSPANSGNSPYDENFSCAFPAISSASLHKSTPGSLNAGVAAAPEDLRATKTRTVISLRLRDEKELIKTINHRLASAMRRSQ